MVRAKERPLAPRPRPQALGAAAAARNGPRLSIRSGAVPETHVWVLEAHEGRGPLDFGGGRGGYACGGWGF